MTSDDDPHRQPASEAFRVVGSEDWRALLRTGANMFVIGPRGALDAFLAAARSEFAEPVRLVRRSEAVPANPQGTLVLCDAARLNERQRAGMLAWLCAPNAENARVISLSEV